MEIGSGLLDADSVEACDDLLHAMVHIANQQEGQSDVTANQYHKAEFCERALSAGLVVLWHKARGWGVTTSKPNRSVSAAHIRRPTSEAVDRRQTCYKLLNDEWDLRAAKKLLKSELAGKSQRKFQLKYICACKPPMIIRSGRRPSSPMPLNVTCNVCHAKFVLSDDEQSEAP